MIEKVRASRFEKLMTLSAYARRNYLEKHGWKLVQREVVPVKSRRGKEIQRLRILWTHLELNGLNICQTSALQTQIRWDMEVEGVVVREGHPIVHGGQDAQETANSLGCAV